MDNLRDFYGPNAGWLWDQYEKYSADPDSVAASTRELFEQWTPQEVATLDTAVNGVAPATPAVYTQPHAAPAISEDQLHLAMGVANYAQAIREYGHLAANSNPLYSPQNDPSLDPIYHGLTDEIMAKLPATLVRGPVCDYTDNAGEALLALKEIYTGGIGFDYDHLTDPMERGWLRAAAETRQFRPDFDADGKNGIDLLKRLIKVEGFEQFLNKAFVGKKRFSIEGLDMMVPVLDEIVRVSLKYNVTEIVIGMAHRGRLNVLVHVLNKDYKEVFREFKEPLADANTNASGYLGTTGDVKYHKGADRLIGGQTTIKIAPNPSHLEHVNPIVEGMARAASTKTDKPGKPELRLHSTMPIQIHGDAAFSGQGIVAETLNFSDLEGYENGGTIHVIANNQIGFTTNPKDSRSTRYASDLAKGFKIPIVHVNANDPIACLEAACLAAEYRNNFNKDFLIDLIGYRRYGHNEGDEPRFTQPGMYAKIDKMPVVRKMWTQTLIDKGFINTEDSEALWQANFEKLQVELDKVDLDNTKVSVDEKIHHIPAGVAGKTETKLPIGRLSQLHKSLTTLPDSFTPHPRMIRVIKRRKTALEDPAAKAIDWGLAENMAFSTILSDGIPIRITGEDVKRGTFSHRHAVYFDAKTGEEYAPLQALPQAEASFEIHNSPLTEAGMIGFEFGYNMEQPGCLVIWEAQFGDFVNCAQAILDEYVTSGRAKWNLAPSLVLLLPHGHEGQGPDHSSARLERFLQMTAEKNMRIVNCTTAAQYYHLIRRQALLLEKDPLPLIVMSPKSLLRHPRASSSLEEMADGKFNPVLDDTEVDKSKVNRLILCSGKVYIDLISSDLREQNMNVAIARVEQLYPYPKKNILDLYDQYPNLEQLVWLQEEPRNMGAWRFMQPRLADNLPTLAGRKSKKVDFHYIGRRRYASPSEGFSSWHKLTQEKIIADAFDLDYVDGVLAEKRKI
ncbi:MAG: 2-oxoglutarate dehydrogenase E1 component [Anaerolineae bacterium]